MDRAADNTGPLSVQTVDAEGKAPKRRISTATAAYQAYQKQRQANIRRDARFGDMAGIYAGFPPTPPIQNERNGQADMPNVNTKQFQAKVSTYTATWTAINSQSDGFADVQLSNDDPMVAERWSKIATEEFNNAIRHWDSTEEDDFESGAEYMLESSARDTQMGLFGVGVAFFRDPIDFRFMTVPSRRVLIPDGTRLTLSNCPAVFIEDNMSVTDLYGMIDKPGWNKGAILRNLYDHVELMNPSASRRFTYSEWVNEIRNNDTYILSEFLPVRLIHGFVKEFDGTITQVTFTDLYGDGRPPGGTDRDRLNEKNDDYKKDGEGFMYEKTDRAKRWRQVLIPFADNAGPECDWHGVKGFGDLIFDGCHLNNQMFNRACIGAIMGNTLMFKGSTEADAQKMDQIVFTQFGMLAPGLDFEQVRFQADMEAAMLAFNSGSQIMAENTRIAPQNEKTVTSEQPTATQVNADRADRAQFTSLQISIYRAVGLDVLFGEMYRRIAQPERKYPASWAGGMVAKRFRENCKRRGIPEADLLKVKLVRANRNTGSGDLALDLMKGKELLGVATPGEGQMNARYQIACALVGVDAAGAYVQREEEPPGQAEAILSMENNLIQVGQVPIPYGWQNQEEHVTSHLQLLGQAAQAVSQVIEQGIAPPTLEGAKKLNNLLFAGIQHVGAHLGLMSQVPRTGKGPALHETFVKEATKQLHNLQQLNEALGEDIQKADVQQQPQPSPEMIKAQQQLQIEGAKAQQTMALKDQEAKAKLAQTALQNQAEAEAKLTQHQLDMALEADRVQQELAAKAKADALAFQSEAAMKQQSVVAAAAKSAIEINAADQKAKASEKAARSRPKPKDKN